MEITEIVLQDGTKVRVRPVPPGYVTDVLVARPDLADPPVPLIEEEGIGGKKTFPARSGQVQFEEWQIEKDKREAERDNLSRAFLWDYGVVSWRLQGKGAWKEWPPDDWEIPAMLQEYGVKPREGKRGRRVDYIQTLFKSNEDTFKALGVMHSQDYLTKEEVDAAEASFPGDQTRERDTGDTG